MDLESNYLTGRINTLDKAEPCDAHEAPRGTFTNGDHMGGAR